MFIKSPPGAEHGGSATGFQVKAPSGTVYTLTNAHVCGLQKDGFVLVSPNGPRSSFIPRRVLHIYADNDLCLVEAMPGYGGLSLASDYDMGDINYVLGYPMGEAQDFAQGYLKDHVAILIALPEVSLDNCTGPYQSIEAVQTWFGDIPMCMIKRQSIATNINIYPGNSGSALVNAFGNVTGVIFAGGKSPDWGYAVPLEDVINFLKAY